MLCYHLVLKLPVCAIWIVVDILWNTELFITLLNCEELKLKKKNYYYNNTKKNKSY